MKDKIIITRIPGFPMQRDQIPAHAGQESGAEEQDRLFLCRLDSRGKVSEIRTESADPFPIGTICMGRVQKILPDLNAAFIEIAPGFTCFYHINQNPEPISARRSREGKLTQGDEILVQIEREAVKTKQPQATSNLNLTGRFLVLTTGNKKFGISAKLSATDRDRFHALLEEVFDGAFGIIVRTNAAGVPDAQILREFKQLKAQLDDLLAHGVTRATFSRIREADAFWLDYIRGAYPDQIDEIVTDDPGIYTQLREYLDLYEDCAGITLRSYQDSYELYKVYSLKEQIEHARRKKVWMNSGAYLIIEPTEAMTVIDVNSGKHVSKKDPEAQHLAVNLEACDEICRQMRLRNLSGIIIVDFINLKRAEDNKTLFSHLQKAAKADPVPVQVVDQTRLGLIEITRKKTAKTLEEQLT